MYTSSATFVHGFKAAIWVGVAFSAVGAAAAAVTAGRRQTTPGAVPGHKREAVLSAIG
jgi:hypothetical protein